MIKGTGFTILYMKNAVLFAATIVLVLGFFPEAMQDVQYLVDNYSTMPDSLRVVLVSGFAAITLILTSLEANFLVWLVNKYNKLGGTIAK